MPSPSNMSINETTRRLQHLLLIHNFWQKRDTAPLFHNSLATLILEQGILLFQCLRRKSSGGVGGQPGPVCVGPVGQFRFEVICELRDLASPERYGLFLKKFFLYEYLEFQKNE